MPTMSITTALEWMKANRTEFERLVHIGYMPAVKAQRAWWAAKEARDGKRGDFPRLRDYWLECLNDFVSQELNIAGRAELRGKFDYKASDYK